MIASVVELAADSVLTRTREGTLKMRARSPQVSPKLRSVLFLISGLQSYRELLERAGGLRGVLDAQIHALLEMGLIEVHREGARLDDSPPQGALPAVAAAKIELLKRIEAAAGKDADRFAAGLLAARTLRDLAERSKEVALMLQASAGSAVADAFWTQAKEILLTWRDHASQASR